MGCDNGTSPNAERGRADVATTPRSASTGLVRRPWLPLDGPVHHNPLVGHEPCARVAAVLDTSAEALKVLASVHRRMPGIRKLLLACDMSDSVRTLTIARIRAQHPDFDDGQIREQLTLELYGVGRQR